MKCLLTYSVIEQLLELLIGVVDTELFKAVEVEDFKTSNIKDSNEASALSLGSVKTSVDPGHYPLEQPLVGGLADGFHGELDLFLGLSLGHIVTTHLDPWLEECLSEVCHLKRDKDKKLY